MIELDKKSYIWSTTNRVIHILLIVTFAITYILADDDYLRYHATFAILFGLVVLFRIVWGFIGPKYSKFKDFNFKLSELKEYLMSPFSNIKQHIGHNPASSWAIILMFLFGFLAILSGMLAFGAEHHHGVFAYMYSESFKEMEIFEEIHEVSANALVAVIVVHIIGALIDKYIKGNDAINSMIDGYKITIGDYSIKINIFQKIFSLISLIVFIAIFLYLFITPDNIFVSDSMIFEKQ
jgi:cytochrome b